MAYRHRIAAGDFSCDRLIELNVIFDRVPTLTPHGIRSAFRELLIDFRTSRGIAVRATNERHNSFRISYPDLTVHGKKLTDNDILTAATMIEDRILEALQVRDALNLLAESERHDDD